MFYDNNSYMGKDTVRRTSPGGFVNINPGILTLLLFISFAISACGFGQTRPSRFYSLSADAHLTPLPVIIRKPLSVVVGPLQLPAYLQRPEVILRQTANEISLEEFHRWAEPLEQEIPRVMVNNLLRLLPTDNIDVYPTRLFHHYYSVPLNFFRFEAAADGLVQLQAQWSIIDSRSDEILMMRSVELNTEVDGDGFAATAAAQSRLLAQLSRTIAESILQLSAADKPQ